MKTQMTKILLIEDDEEDFILLKKHLSRIRDANYDITWEDSYESGLSRLFEETYDICLTDYRLGIHDGIELIQEARKQGVTLPIILLTGASGPEIDMLALQAGADDYISKGQLQGELLYRVIRYAIRRKQAELERERLLREQIASRELEKRRTEFISMVVHELKTPLTSLKGYTQLLRRRCERTGDEQAAQLTIRMDMQTTKLTALINDFLDITRLSGGKLQFREEYFLFDELVQEVIEELQQISPQPPIRREGEIHTMVWGDRMRIGQVITNFITNAAKYAPASKYILVKSAADEHTITLTVQDFGPGIPKAQQAKIFDAFYRATHPEQKVIPGLGLGLHISAEIIKRQEGHIWVESEEGKGAIFGFTLPLDRNRIASPQEQGEPEVLKEK